MKRIIATLFSMLAVNAMAQTTSPDPGNQPANQPGFQGKTAGGQTQTTIVDANGNLKIVTTTEPPAPTQPAAPAKQPSPPVQQPAVPPASADPAKPGMNGNQNGVQNSTAEDSSPATTKMENGQMPPEAPAPSSHPQPPAAPTP